MINKVLLITPPNTMPADSIRRLATPLGFLYMGAVLENDYEVKIIDSTCDGYYNHYFSDDKKYITTGEYKSHKDTLELYVLREAIKEGVEHLVADEVLAGGPVDKFWGNED